VVAFGSVVPELELELDEPLIDGSVDGSVVPAAGSVVVASDSLVTVGSVADVSWPGAADSCRAHAEARSNAPIERSHTLRFKVHLTVCSGRKRD
jgi:hypothetical protein